jgi:hypothetical protein
VERVEREREQRAARDRLEDGGANLAVPGRRLGLVVAVGLDLGDVGEEVHLRRLSPRRLGVELLDDEEEGEEAEGDIVGEELGGVPLAVEEDGPAGEDGDDHDHDAGKVGSRQGERGLEGEDVSGEACGKGEVERREKRKRQVSVESDAWRRRR